MKPKIHTSSANASLEQSVSGVVTIGEESAIALNAKFDTDTFKAGDKIDLGTLAYHHPNWFKRMWGTLKIKKHPLNN